MSTQPTDAELKALWRIHAADIGGIIYYARAVLDKWGTPAGAEEPFCWHWENTFNGGMGAVKKNPETLGINMSHPDYKWTALYTAPQPVAREPVAWKHDCAALLTNDVELWIDACPHCGKPRNAPQPVARGPLTDGQIQDLLLCGNPTDEEMRLIRIGWDAARDIKGGQHG